MEACWNKVQTETFGPTPEVEEDCPELKPTMTQVTGRKASLLLAHYTPATTLETSWMKYAKMKLKLQVKMLKPSPKLSRKKKDGKLAPKLHQGKEPKCTNHPYLLTHSQNNPSMKDLV